MAERDPMTFETRLADAFEQYVAAGAPVDVDARTIGPPWRSALAVLELSGTDDVVRRGPVVGVGSVSRRNGPGRSATGGPAGADGPCLQWLPEVQL